MTSNLAAELRLLLGADAVLTEPDDLVRYQEGWRYGRGIALLDADPNHLELGRTHILLRCQLG